MSDNLEYVALNVGGMAYEGWTRVGVGYSAKHAVRSFGCSLTENVVAPFGALWNLFPGSPCTITSNGELIVTGNIESMSPSFSDRDHKVEVSGRSKGGDSVDSSAVHPKGEFKNKTIHQIAQELDRQGVGFSTDVQGLEQIPIFRLNLGESVHSAIERIARKQGLLLVGQPDGSIKIQKGGTKSVHAPLIEGVNILGASAQFGDAARHSSYTVKGQRALGGLNKGSIRVEGSAKDTGVSRHRPKVLTSETDTKDGASARKRAKNHANRAIGESIKATVKCQGWRCSKGILWQPNTLITVHSPMLKLNMDMLIESVSLTQDSSGSFSSLSLVHPLALGSTASAGPGAAKQWAAPAVDSEPVTESGPPE